MKQARDSGGQISSVGLSPLRVEDERLLTGKGRFVDALSPPQLAHAVLVRSPHAHARLRGLDIARARRMPGVLGVFTSSDLAGAGIKPLSFHATTGGENGAPMTAPPRCALASDTLRYVGEPVALVVAETRYQAMDAAEAVELNVDVLPAVTGVEQAMAPGHR